MRYFTLNVGGMVTERAPSLLGYSDLLQEVPPAQQQLPLAAPGRWHWKTSLSPQWP